MRSRVRVVPAKLLPAVGGWMRGNPRGQVRFAGPLSHVALHGDVSDAGQLPCSDGRIS
jgi:hypothetical protein